MTLAEVNVMRQKIDLAVVEPLETTDAMEGRGFLLGASLFSGLTSYGPGLINIVNSNSQRINIGMYMLGAGSLFFVPYFATKDKPVSYGQANMVYYGLSRGFVHGLLFGLSSVSNYDKNVSRVAFTTGEIMGIAETELGFQLVKKLHISNGNADLITVFGDYGFYGGFGIASQLNLLNNDNNGRITAALTASGSLCSEVAGYYIGKKYPVSTGDAEIIYSTAMLGAFLPLTFVDMINPNQVSTYTTPSVLMGVAGLYIGYQLTRDKDFSFTQGFITKLGTVAGGLVGCGLTYLFVNKAKSWEYLAGSYIGAQASFYVLYEIDKNLLNAVKIKNVGINFMPQNYLLGLEISKHNPMLQGMVPLASLNYSF